MRLTAYKSILIIAIISFLLMVMVRWLGLSGTNYQSIIGSDGLGYYHYYHLLFYPDKAQNQEVNRSFLVETSEGAVVNKYYVGTALAQSPVLLPIMLFLPKPLNLFHPALQMALSASAWIYLILGLLALRKWLLEFKIKEQTIALALWFIFFATNLSYYALIEPSMSHLYSFAFTSFVLWSFQRLIRNVNLTHVFAFVFFTVILFLIRPVNLILLLVLPIHFVSFESFKRFIISVLKHRWALLIGFGLAILPVFIQIYFWHLQTSQFILWSYANEGFYFAKPHIVDFLFSFRKGFFIYTPLALWILLFFILSKQDKFVKAILSIWLVLLVYLLSSWWNWYYGDSYGSRVMIDFLPLFTLMFALGLDSIKPIFQKVFLGFSLMVMVLNLFQTYQYYYGIISRFDMNLEKYAYTLGKFKGYDAYLLGGNNDIIPYHHSVDTLLNFNFIDPPMGVSVSDESNNMLQNEDYCFSHSSENIYGIGFKIPAKLWFQYTNAYVQLSYNTHLEKGSTQEVFWVLNYVDSTGNSYHYQSFKINGVPPEIGQERLDLLKFSIPNSKSVHDSVQFYVWNKSQSQFTLSNLQFQLLGLTRIKH